jgi:hypothetical protein
MTHDELIKETYKTMIDHGITVKIHAALPDLTRRLSVYMGEDIHPSTISNALIGYRTGKRSVQILEAINSMLSGGDYTHQKANCN